MLHRTAARIAASAIALLGLGLLAAPASAATAARPVPSAVRELCTVTHTSCAGHWVRVGGVTVYRIDAPFAIDRHGAVHPLATGCNTSGAYCTVSNVGGGKCWSDNSQSGNGVKVVLNNCDPASVGQIWAAMSGLGGSGLSWQVFNDYRCLNDPNGSKSAGVQQQMWNCYATAYEDYGLSQVGPGNSQLLLGVDGTNPSNNSNTCITDNGNASSGAPLLTAGCNGSVNQRWVYP